MFKRLLLMGAMEAPSSVGMATLTPIPDGRVTSLPVDGVMVISLPVGVVDVL